MLTQDLFLFISQNPAKKFLIRHSGLTWFEQNTNKSTGRMFMQFLPGC